MTLLDEDRLFPSDGRSRDLARALFATVRDLPIVSPHGHTDPRWLAENNPFANPAELFVTPDHYVFRMLFSQGVRLEDLGIQTIMGTEDPVDPREVWRTFAEHYYVFRGTPSRLWIDHSLQTVFGVEKVLSAKTADEIYDKITDCLFRLEFRPRALFDKFDIEVIATTESPLDTLEHHAQIASSGWNGRVITTYRPDVVIDPENPDFLENLKAFSETTDEDALTWAGYLNAHRKRRRDFIAHGATASDHGHPSARTENLSDSAAQDLFASALRDPADPKIAEAFRAQMLTEMAKMSMDDGLVMQIHPGSRRNHSHSIFNKFGTDMGFDIPGRTNYVEALGPLLDVVGHEPDFTLIVFTLDETSYGRELAPLAGVYPALKLGPAWWFFDSPDGMWRFREMITETAGFYNTVGFNDDTRAFCSIPARHDVARRVDCAYLASLVTSGRLSETDAFELAQDLTYKLAKKAYHL
ncbi:MAG: glucuronate isomerase [Paracoccaceae bacterium]|nr:glucuronate isomerase [Marinovum sp.]MDG1425640.1 glucuronate isomerase [Paracoccaceae bacterium]|tara:strand:- start:4171 stop:5577 length:1407 start_codon:yes stop_codon:yes gene_type:complete